MEVSISITLSSNQIGVNVLVYGMLLLSTPNVSNDKSITRMSDPELPGCFLVCSSV